MKGKAPFSVSSVRIADRHDLRVAFRQPNEFVRRHVQLVAGIVRMRTDGAEDAGIALGESQQRLDLADSRRDRHHLFDARLMRTRDKLVTLCIEIGEVEMAMGIDQHRFYALPVSGAT